MTRAGRDRGRGSDRSRPAGSRILRLYPAAWRRRYEPEMLAMLEELRPGPRARVDLARGAIDARLHDPTRFPVVAALGAGGLWTVAGVGVVGQPVPPDWPGYLLETLPIALLATILSGLATLGCWARRSDAAGRAGRVAIALAIVGHLAWTLALIAALVGAGYGAPTMAAQVLGVLGACLVGLVLLRTGDEPIGTLLVVGPAVMLFGWPIGWLGFGLGWTLVGVLLLGRPAPDDGVSPGFA